MPVSAVLLGLVLKDRSPVRLSVRWLITLQCSYRSDSEAMCEQYTVTTPRLLPLSLILTRACVLKASALQPPLTSVRMQSVCRPLELLLQKWLTTSCCYSLITCTLSADFTTI